MSNLSHTSRKFTDNLERDLDPENGWNADRIVCSVGESPSGNPEFEAVISLGEFEKIWFPDKIVYYKDGRIINTVTVQRAVFNRVAPKRCFTPTDIGAEPGFTLSYAGAPPDPTHIGVIWGGDGIYTAREWRAIQEKERREDGPLVQQLAKYGATISPFPDLAPEIPVDLAGELLSMWTIYVRNFVHKYNCNADQGQKAELIRSECEHIAREFLGTRELEIAEVERRLQDAVGTDRFPAARDAESKLRIELGKPLQKIFDEKLKPRLHALLTRAQVEAANVATTQPASQRVERP